MVNHIFVIALIPYSSSYAHGACDILRAGLTKEEKFDIEERHNNARWNIARGSFENQPRGINLKKISWDDKLAAAAQRIANTCQAKHKTVTDDRWKTVGQNLYTSNSANLDDVISWGEAIDSWLSQSKKYKYPNKSSSATRYYTQVIWALTNRVGCGFTYFRSNRQYHKLYICNYGPGGNTAGAPYKTGTSGCEALC